MKRPHLPAWNERRRTNARVYHQCVVRLPDRDRVRAHLASCGVGTEVYYPVPLHAQECFAHLGAAAGSFPHATAMARDSLALPIFPELTRAQQEYVVSSIAGVLR